MSTLLLLALFLSIGFVELQKIYTSDFETFMDRISKDKLNKLVKDLHKGNLIAQKKKVKSFVSKSFAKSEQTKMLINCYLILENVSNMRKYMKSVFDAIKKNNLFSEQILTKLKLLFDDSDYSMVHDFAAVFEDWIQDLKLVIPRDLLLKLLAVINKAKNNFEKKNPKVRKELYAYVHPYSPGKKPSKRVYRILRVKEISGTLYK